MSESQPAPQPKKPRKRIRRVALWFLGFVTLVLLVAAVVCATIGGPASIELDVRPSAEAGEPLKGDTLRVATLNIAHGRSTSFHQALQSKSSLEQNMTAIGKLVADIDCDVVGFQEIDRPSIWSRRLDQISAIGTHLPGHRAVSGQHVDGYGLHYGTAVFSRLAIHSSVSHRFDATPPTFPKGFVVAKIDHAALPDGAFDFVSVHLDFASASRRKNQMQRMVRELKKRARPLIVVGDLNCDWDDADGVLPQFAQQLDLHTFKPTDASLITFPSLDWRIDWILVSSDFEITDMAVSEEEVSDHRLLYADLQIKRK